VLRRRSVGFGLVILLVWVAMSPIGGQVAPLPPAGPRDAVPQPTVRQVPIGSGRISGIVTAAESGRPLRNVNITLTGASAGPQGPVTSIRGGIDMPGGGGRPGTGGGTQSVRGGIAGGGLGLSRSAVTDDQGRFLIDHLPAGRYTLNANRSQYLAASYGQKRPGRPGTTVSLAEGQRLEIRWPLVRGGVIAGTVFADDGEPAAAARIQVLRFGFNNGIRRLMQTGGTSSDDRGVYRVFGLQPGEYIIAVTPNPADLLTRERLDADRATIERAIAAAGANRGGATMVTIPVAPTGPMSTPAAGYAATYYPSTPVAAAAAMVLIGPGEERSGIDIHVQPVRAAIVRGTIEIPPGLPVTVQVSLESQDPSVPTSLPSTRIAADGRFTLRDVPPGQYTVVASTLPLPEQIPTVGGPAAPPRPPTLEDQHRLWARQPVSLGANETADVFLQLRQGRRVSGQVVFEMAQPLDLSRARLTVTITPARALQPVLNFGPPLQGIVAPDGRFTVGGLAPGSYLLRINGGVARSAMVNGRDVLDFPLEVGEAADVDNVVITVGDRTSELTGRITDAAGQPGSDYTIVVVADDRRYWIPGSRRIVITRPGTDGTYTLRNLPAGGYYLAAVTDIEPGGQFDPAFLEELPAAATHVVITEGGRHVHDVRTAGQ
jgi:hypothetical protein